MEFRTIVDISKPPFLIEPLEEMLFVGSCFADAIGQRFAEERFRAVVNPFGVMYNPASVLHTIERYDGPAPRVVFITLGTNHVYRLKETGEIVDNCQKRPATLFQEEVLSIAECASYLQQAVEVLMARRADVRVVITVSPIRYRKYGYHESQLSKAVLLMAADSLCNRPALPVTYFPAYEIILDELRDYRFYQEDMLHPSPQAVDYIWERLQDSYFSDDAKQFLKEWQPLKRVLHHRPFNPDSEEYRELMDKTMLKVDALLKKYRTFAL